MLVLLVPFTLHRKGSDACCVVCSVRSSSKVAPLFRFALSALRPTALAETFDSANHTDSLHFSQPSAPADVFVHHLVFKRVRSKSARRLRAEADLVRSKIRFDSPALQLSWYPWRWTPPCRWYKTCFCWTQRAKGLQLNTLISSGKSGSVTTTLSAVQRGRCTDASVVVQVHCCSASQL